MAEPPRKLPPKLDVAQAMLERSSVYVHLDPRRPGVVVPKHFTKQPQLVLQVGLNMVIPIPDLTVDADGISCTLSFNRAGFWCHMPWTAVYALVTEDGSGGMIWPEDVPPELPVTQGPAPEDKARVRRPRPKAVPAAKENAAPEAPTDNVRALHPPKRPEAAPRPAPALARDDGAPTEAPARAPSPGKKPKRELPPYLRVVK